MNDHTYKQILKALAAAERALVTQEVTKEKIEANIKALRALKESYELRRVQSIVGSGVFSDSLRVRD